MTSSPVTSIHPFCYSWTDMHWFNVTAAASKETANSLEDWFWEHGAVSVTVEDGSDTPIFEPGVGEHPLWHETLVTGLFESDVELEALRLELGNSGYAVKAVDKVEDRPWEREWLDRFQPMQFGERIWICPTGHEIDADAEVVIHLDPGLAFGSGTHETTRLILEYLDRHSPENQTVLDYGCGSGVLAIAAALLGAASVVAVDIDHQAITATLDNAGRNEVKVDAFVVEAKPIESADLVLANILAAPLVELAESISALINPGGRLVLSGVMSSQSEWVAGAYNDRLLLIEQHELNGWVRQVWQKS